MVGMVCWADSGEGTPGQSLGPAVGAPRSLRPLRREERRVAPGRHGLAGGSGPERSRSGQGVGGHGGEVMPTSARITVQSSHWATRPTRPGCGTLLTRACTRAPTEVAPCRLVRCPSQPGPAPLTVHSSLPARPRRRQQPQSRWQQGADSHFSLLPCLSVAPRSLETSP